jgi:type VI secretion system protein VasJ
MDRTIGSAFDAIVSPFEGDAPYGANVQYGDRYEAIQREIQKLTAASSKETSVDWKAVRDLSIELLSEESKDLSIACFLTVALFIEDGYAGARDGLDVVRTFVSDHWEGIFPPIKRISRRANDLRWLIERLAPLVEDREIKAAEVEHLQAMVEASTALGDFSREVLKEKAPPFGELTGPLTARAGDAAELQPAAPPSGEGREAATAERTGGTAEPESSAPQATPAPEAPKQPKGAAGITIEEGSSAADIRGQMEAVIKPLRDADPLSPVSYRFLRILKWDGVSGPPSAGETRIPGPRANEINSLQALYDSANWAGLLDRSENTFKAGHIWLLDLQRFTSLSLEQLDPRGQDSVAAEAVKDATRELLKRNTALVDCSYAGGIPFASDETRSWLAEISDVEDFKVRLARSAPEDGEKAAFEPGDLDEAIKLLRSKQLTEGMEILQRGIQRAADRRSQFRARLDSARACLDANQAAWARPMLESLQREADTLTFESWEPGWAIELYQLMAICYGRLAKAAKGDEQQNFTALLNTIQDALLRLDMQAAAAVQEEL